MADIVVAFSTFPADKDPIPLAQDLVGAGLAACVHIVPGVTSVYTWKGVPQVDREQQLVIKTTTDMVDELWEAVKARHPYETPEFVVIPVADGSQDYLDWIEENVGPKRES